MNAKSLVPLTALALLLSACSTVPTNGTAASPSPKSSPNEAACQDFAGATDRFSTLVIAAFNEDGLTDVEDSELAAIGGTFDSIALSAEGEVKERMAVTASIVLEDGVTLGISPDEYFESVGSVARACDADGFESRFATWS